LAPFSDKSYDEVLSIIRQGSQDEKAANPTLDTAAQLTGTVAGTIPMMIAAPELFGAGLGGYVPVAMSGLTGATLAGADAVIRSGGDPEATQDAVYWGGLAGLAGPAIGSLLDEGIRGAGRLMRWRAPATRVEELYDLPARSQRPFEADYPGPVDVDETGRLLTDRLGLPIHTRNVIGRQTKGGPDVPTSPEADRAVARALGAEYKTAKRKEIGGLGRARARRHPVTDEVFGDDITIADDLHPLDVPRAGSHELGHLIRWVASYIPTDGLEDELLPLYSISQTGTARPLTRPQDLGYSDADTAEELMAEAFRAYLRRPNEMKTDYLKTADRLANVVNRDPRLRELIHLNSLLVGTGGAGIGADAMFGGDERRRK
jgi:hypothetical protein